MKLSVPSAYVVAAALSTKMYVSPEYWKCLTTEVLLPSEPAEASR